MRSWVSLWIILRFHKKKGSLTILLFILFGYLHSVTDLPPHSLTPSNNFHYPPAVPSLLLFTRLTHYSEMLV